MSLRGKLLVAQLPLALALLIVGGVSLRATRELGSSSSAILKDNYRSVLAAQRMYEALGEIEGAATAVVVGNRADALAQTAAARQRFEAELEVQEGNVTELGEREATSRLRASWNQYRAAFEKLAATADAAQARSLFIDQVQPLSESIRSASEEILGINQDAMVRKSETARRASQRVDTLVILATLLALIAGGMASSTLTARLLRPLSVLSQAARRIGEGDLEARARVSGGDEVAHLAREFNTMADRLRKYRETTLGELLQAQGAAQAAIDSLPDPVIAFDAAGAVLAANQVAERELQVSLEAGSAALASVNPELRAVLERLRAHVLSGKGPYVPKGYEEAIRVAGHEGERWLLPRATPVYAEGGGISGATVVLQDVSRLRRVDELKNDLVATVAHEFRTPLTSLRMAIHLCLEGAAGPITEKQTELLHAGREDCERLQGIVDDLLDLSRVQSGQVTLERKDVVLEQLLERARGAVAASAAEKHVSFTVENLAAGASVEVDAERIELVFSNLLANALRYSADGGEVVIRARPQASGVRVEVADRGPGVPEAYRGRIFEKYFRVPGAPGGAAGLGLHICREIVLAHGGEIGMEPRDGGGSIFWFTLPLPPATG